MCELMCTKHVLQVSVCVFLWHATTARGTRYRRLLLLTMKSHMEEHVAKSDVIFGAAWPLNLVHLHLPRLQHIKSKMRQQQQQQQPAHAVVKSF